MHTVDVRTYLPFFNASFIDREIYDRLRVGAGELSGRWACRSSGNERLVRQATLVQTSGRSCGGSILY